MPNPLIGHKSFWLRQLSDCAEPDVPAVLQTLQTLGGGDGLILKSMDGTTWEGTIDPKTPVHSIADVQAVARLCEASGVAFCPVVVPRGQVGEAAAHAALAAALGALVVDLEPFAGLYDEAPLSTIPAYCQALRAGAPDAYLVLQPDPRPYAYEAINLPGIAPLFDGIAGQHYCGWTDVGWTDVAAEVQRFQQLAGLGRDTHVTVYGAGDTELAGQFWAQVAPSALGLQVFAFGPMNAPQLRAAAAWPKPGGQPTPPVDPCADLQVQLATVTSDRDRLAALLHQIAREAATA